MSQDQLGAGTGPPSDPAATHRLGFGSLYDEVVGVRQTVAR